MVNIIILFMQAIAGILTENIVEYFLLRIKMFQQSSGVDAFGPCEHDGLDFSSMLLQVLQEIIHMVSFINEDG